MKTVFIGLAGVVVLFLFGFQEKKDSAEKNQHLIMKKAPAASVDSIPTHSKGALKAVKSNKTKVQRVRKAHQD
jgi:hypothetical protein